MAEAPKALNDAAVALTEELNELLGLDMEATSCGYNVDGETMADAQSVSAPALKVRIVRRASGERTVTFWDSRSEHLPDVLVAPLPEPPRKH